MITLLLLTVLQTAPTCDASLQAHVYHPQRLKQLQECVAVSGTIVDATKGVHKNGLRHEADGDTHGWLKVDPQFENLLNDGNKSAEGGNLVFEIVCMYSVHQADAKSACKGYKSKIKVPPVGSQVVITGVLVQDQEHAQWNEIHPVTSITVVKAAAGPWKHRLEDIALGAVAVTIIVACVYSGSCAGLTGG